MEEDIRNSHPMELAVPCSDLNYPPALADRFHHFPPGGAERV